MLSGIPLGYVAVRVKVRLRLCLDHMQGITPNLALTLT
jgi:hypothetical protein